jgi:hypothetical protein
MNIVILNWQRPLWEGDYRVVKCSGRVEPVWVIIHICMETTQRISLYSYLYLKLACHDFLIIFYVFSSTKSENKRVDQVLPRGRGWRAWGGGPNNVCTCK